MPAPKKRDTSTGFEPSVPTTPSVTRPCFAALRMDGALERGTLSPALHQLLLNMARVKNVVSSLRLEQIDIDLRRAREVVQARASHAPHEREVLRFAERYKWVHETPGNELPEPSIDLITELHHELLRDDPEIPKATLGQLKAKQNAIVDAATGRERFIPTPPERTEAELNALFQWLGHAQDAYPPGTLAAVFFAEFQAIHPFRDGNGRIGRLLNLIVLKRLGHEFVALVPLDGRFYATAHKYYETIATTNDGTSWHVWARYFTKQLKRAYEIAAKRADLQPLLDQQGSGVSRDVLGWVLEGAGQRFQRSDYPNPEGYSGSAITKALANLANQGVLTPEGEKRGRTYRLSTTFLEEVYGGLDLGE